MTEDQKAMLEFATQFPARFAQRLGYVDMKDELHGVWMKKMLFGEEDMTLQSHRGSFKTTCISVVLSLMLGLNGDKTIMFLRKTESDVVEVIEQVSKILKSDFYQGWYSVLFGKPLKIVSENQLSITTDAYSAPRGAVQLLGIGITGSLTGKHADIIFTDDIVNIKDRISQAERERTKRMYQELQNIKNRGGRIINTGTPWHVEDCFAIMPPAEKYDCYQTGLITPEELRKIKCSMIPSLFAANYELRHIASEDALFDSEIEWTDDVSKLQDGIAHIDAAYGGEDFTVLTIARRAGDKIYMYGKIYRTHVQNVLPKILDDVDKYYSHKIYCETNGDKGYLGRDIRNMGYSVNMYPERMNKFLKISSYLRKWWKNIIWVRGTDDMYLDQIIAYTQDAEHDDAPDSAACICRILDRDRLEFM